MDALTSVIEKEIVISQIVNNKVITTTKEIKMNKSYSSSVIIASLIATETAAAAKAIKLAEIAAATPKYVPAPANPEAKSAAKAARLAKRAGKKSTKKAEAETEAETKKTSKKKATSVAKPAATDMTAKILRRLAIKSSRISWVKSSSSVATPAGDALTITANVVYESGVKAVSIRPIWAAPVKSRVHWVKLNGQAIDITRRLNNNKYTLANVLKKFFNVKSKDSSTNSSINQGDPVLNFVNAQPTKTVFSSVGAAAAESNVEINETLTTYSPSIVINTTVTTPMYSIDTKAIFRTDEEWSGLKEVFNSAYNSDRIANGLVVASNNRGPRTKEALNSKSPFGHIANLAKALAWSLAGGLEIPIEEGQPFVVPQIEYFEGKNVCTQPVIPGLAILRAKGEDRTAKVIAWLKQQNKLKAFVKEVRDTVKKYQSNLPYNEKVALCLAWVLTKYLPEKAEAKVLVLKHWDLGSSNQSIEINASWNYPRYNANSSSIRTLVEFISNEYARLGIPTGLHFVHGEDCTEGYKVYLLDEVFTVTDTAVYYEGYCRQYIQRVLMYPPVDYPMSVEDVALITSFDILTNIIVEFVVIHTNRETGYGERLSGWNGFLSAKDINITFGNARNGLRKLMQKHVPVLDLEGTVDLDPQKAHHLMSSVTPCPRYVYGTEYTAFVGDISDKPSEFIGRGGKALFNARHKDVSSGTKTANVNENKLLIACMLNDSGKGTMQPIIQVCNDLRLKVVITGNARKIADLSNFACAVADLAPGFQRDFIIKVTGRLIGKTDRAEIVEYLNTKSAYKSTVSGLEVESDAWWTALINDAVIPYSTKGAKIDKRVLPALVASNVEQTDSAMQWFGAATFVDHTVETVIAPCFNLAAPGIGYGNYNNRKQFSAFYNQSTSPAEMVGVVTSVQMLVKAEFTFVPSTTPEGFNFFNCEGVEVRKGTELAKVTLIDGTEIVIDAENDGNLTQFAYRQIEKEIFGVRYFETACSYRNYADTVKLRNGIKTNVVWSNDYIFSLNAQKPNWDLFIPADAYKAADILWYQMPEIAASFSLFEVGQVVAGFNPRALLLAANTTAAEILGYNVEEYCVDNKLCYSPVADLYGCYDDLREAFEVIYGQVKYMSYRNAADLYNFCVKFYSPAVEAKVWRNLTESELAVIASETGLNVEFKMAIADTEDLNSKTNVILLYGENCVAYRGWAYGSNVIDGIYCAMMHPVKVEYTTIPQSVSKSKVMFGTAIDLGSESFDFGAYVYNGGQAFHNRYVMLENVVAGKSFAGNVEVINLDSLKGIEQILIPTQIAQLKSLLATANRSTLISEFAALTTEKSYKANGFSFLIYFPLLASFGFDAANKSSVMTIAGRTYELIAHLLEGKNFGDKEVTSLLRSIENLLTKMVGVIEDEDGNQIEKRNGHRESVSYGAQTVSCKIASCADITMDKMYVLKNGLTYRKMVNVYGKEQVDTGSLYVSYYRPPMTKAVACQVIIITDKENAKRDFPLSAHRLYGSFFAMNYNEGDQDGDGISSFYTPEEDVINNRVELASLDGMLLFIEQAIEYNQCSLEFWLKLEPYYAEQFYADHFNVKTFVEKAGKRGPSAKKSLISWSTWTENVRGAVAQQSVFVGCSYKAQAHHTMLITILQDLVNCSWVDENTKALIESSYGYALNKSAKYPVQNSYELALGGFDPNMAQVGALFLLKAWGAEKELDWAFQQTSLGPIFEHHKVSYDLSKLLGSAFLEKRESNIIDPSHIKIAFNELGYQERWIKPLLNQFMIAGFTDAVNKELNKAEKVDEDTSLALKEVGTLETLCKLYPTYAVAIATSQAVLSTSRSEGQGILDFVVKNVPAEIVTGFAGLIDTNIVMYMQNKIKSLRTSAKKGEALDKAAISDVVRTFVSTLTDEIQVNEIVEEVTIDVTEEEYLGEDNYVSEEEDEDFSFFSPAQLTAITSTTKAVDNVETVKVLVVEETEEEEEILFFSADQLRIIHGSINTGETEEEVKIVTNAIEEEEGFGFFSIEQINKFTETAPMIEFKNKDSVLTLEVVEPNYTVTEVISEGPLGSIVKTEEKGTLFICYNEDKVRATVEKNEAAFNKLATCNSFTSKVKEELSEPAPQVEETTPTTTPQVVEEVTVKEVKAEVEVENTSGLNKVLEAYYTELNTVFTSITKGDFTAVKSARLLLDQIEKAAKTGEVHPSLIAPCFPEKKPVIKRVELSEFANFEVSSNREEVKPAEVVQPVVVVETTVKPVEPEAVVETVGTTEEAPVFIIGMPEKNTNAKLLSNEYSIRFKDHNGKAFNSVLGAMVYYMQKPGQVYSVLHTLSNCTGRQAKAHAEKVDPKRIRADWNEICDSVLLDLLRSKAKLKAVRQALIETKDFALVDAEDATNKLGKMWAVVRQEVLAAEEVSV